MVDFEVHPPRCAEQLADESRYNEYTQFIYIYIYISTTMFVSLLVDCYCHHKSLIMGSAKIISHTYYDHGYGILWHWILHCLCLGLSTNCQNQASKWLIIDATIHHARPTDCDSDFLAQRVWRLDLDATWAMSGEGQAQDALDAGEKFLRLQVRNGVHTLTHPLKMNVSDLGLHLVICFCPMGSKL